jgi:WD40 repeat protein
MLCVAGHTDHVLGVCWHPSDKMFASCSHDKTVMIWRLDLPVPIHILTGHDSIVYAVRYLPNSNR